MAPPTGCRRRRVAAPLQPEQWRSKEAPMILVRNLFRLKFGQAREAIAAWKEGLAIAERAGVGRGRYRLLTDLVGPEFYTLVFESTYASLADFEQSAQALMAVPEWRTWYPRVTALSEGGHREILTIVD
jgi:hypothetical protein